ncbi:MAG: outer membrane protein assembly factor BamA [Treponemataceae bacterium]|nr:outer membrane protein assembly factor BamA [Treponemataceae bacterium]
MNCFRLNAFKRLCALFIIFSFAAVFSLSAQSDDWFYGKKIQTITYNGLVSVQKSDVDAAMNRYLGQEFSDDLWLEIISTIYSLDFFDDISVVIKPADAANSQAILQFTVVERPVIKEINFTGNTQLRSSSLKEKISMKKGEIFVASRVSLDERRIRDYYLENGYNSVRVSSSYEETAEGVSLTFSIAEGHTAVVSSISFEGNEVFTSRTLKKILNLKEAGYINKGVFQESLLETDRQALVTYYYERGYADFQVLDVQRSVSYNEDKNQDEVVLHYVLKEGEQYTFGGINITGNEIFPAEQLAGLVKLAPGSVYNHTKFVNGYAAIQDLYYENGYTSNVFSPAVDQDTEKHVISYSLDIKEFDRSHVESIIVAGNTKTKDYVILRELPIETGDIFSKAKLTTGLRSLYNTQFFSAISPDITQGSEENLIDLVINVEETSTTVLEFGVAFSGITNPNDMPISFFTNVAETNFLGTGKAVNAKLSLSSTEQTVSLGYTDSWLFNQPVTVSGSIDFSHAGTTCLQYMYLPSGVNTTDYFMDYSSWTIGGSLSMGRRWVQNFGTISGTGGISSAINRNDYDATLYTPVSSSIRDNWNHWGLSNTIWGNISLDARDLYYDPGKGWFASQKLSFTGILPEIESDYFMRTDTKLEYYHTLVSFPVSDIWNFNLVAAFYTGFSFQIPFKGDISQSNQMYIDGVLNGRGWNLYSKRGKAMWSSNFELRIPLATGMLGLDLVADAIALKEDAKSMFTNLSIEDFYFSFGPGLRFSIPQFPLRLLLENTFKVENGKVKWTDVMAFTLSFNIANR